VSRPAVIAAGSVTTRIIFAWTVAAAVVVVLALVMLASFRNREPEAEPDVDMPVCDADMLEKVREEPAEFPAGTHLPDCRETAASGPIDLASFVPEEELIRFEDPRVWWGSDAKPNSEEEDRIMHRAVEPVLRRLIEMVHRRGARLKVYDAYRPQDGIHCATSLHKEGRAIDLSADGLSTEKLAKLCWVAGFDWVYYEGGSAEHVHCSVASD
jgi:hypothetical protein